MSRTQQHGFTLLELMITVALLMVVTGAVFSQIVAVQQRSRAEEARTDITQATREAMDEFIRDIHQAGFPNTRMFATGVLTSTTNDARVSVGLVAVSARDIWFEGDIDQDGTVDSVRYQLTADASGSCPCALRRSQQAKVAGAPTAQSVSYTSQLDNVVNSGAGTASLTIAGTMNFGGTQVANNTTYAAWRTAPLFRYYDTNGIEVSVPADLSSSNMTAATNATTLATIKSVRITLNVLSPTIDIQNRMRPVISMTAVGKINN